MDFTDILGDLLGHKTSRGGRGTDVLNDMFNRRRRAPSSSGSAPLPNEIEGKARELEDILDVANERHNQRRSGRPPAQPAPSHRERTGTSSHPTNDQALILVRAMLNAAKADGQLDREEQDKIMQRLGGSSREAMAFLRDEFARPLDVHEFARSVPIGMEQQVYTMSLVAIDLDTGREAKYLLELANSMRLSPEIREQIHQRYGAPSIY
jgi:uncharacterized membrane protein YebE (DUF533 family)